MLFIKILTPYKIFDQYDFQCISQHCVRSIYTYSIYAKGKCNHILSAVAILAASRYFTIYVINIFINKLWAKLLSCAVFYTGTPGILRKL